MSGKKKLGILGGLGPMSSVYFYELITRHTAAARDQEHIDIILSSRASTPDRTDFIMGRSEESPMPAMLEEARLLERCGAGVIVIPCNTAHYFIDEVRASVNVPTPSIITETVRRIVLSGRKKAGILATEGTVSSGSYQLECERQGLDCAIPFGECQRLLMDIIYGDVKCGKPIDTDKFQRVIDYMMKEGCDCAILGCTELSLINRQCGSNPYLIDSMEALAYSAITLCGYEVTGLFDIPAV